MRISTRNKYALRPVLVAALFLTAVAPMLLFAARSRAQSVPSHPAEAQTYYMFIFTNPVAGKEDEYNKWYNEQHAPDVVSIPGFVGAQRFIFSDVQLRQDATPPKGLKYMVMYKIVTSDLDSVYAEVRRRASNGMTRMSNTIDGSAMLGFTYRAIRPLTIGTPPAGVDTAKLGSLPAYCQIVLADPPSETEAEYSKWYDAYHVPEITAVPGFVSGQRFTFSNIQLNKDTGPKYMTMFKIVSSDISSTIAGFRQLAPKMTDTPVFKTSHTVGYTYKAIGQVIDGDKIRAERARQE